MCTCLAEGSALHYPPLHDAHVLPTSRHQVTVIKQEGDVGHMTAVPSVDMTWCLMRKGERAKQREVLGLMALIVLTDRHIGRRGQNL